MQSNIYVLCYAYVCFDPFIRKCLLSNFEFNKPLYSKQNLFGVHRPGAIFGLFRDLVRHRLNITCICKTTDWISDNSVYRSVLWIVISKLDSDIFVSSLYPMTVLHQQNPFLFIQDGSSSLFSFPISFCSL